MPHCGVVNGHDFIAIARHAAFDSGDHFVLDADVGKGAAHHNVMMTTPRAIAVEIRLRDLMFHQPFASRRVRFDATRGRNMVGGDAIAQNRQRFRVDNVADRCRCHAHAVKIGRIGHISAARAPLIGFAALDLDRLPMFVALIDAGIAAFEHFAADRGSHRLVDFLIAGPNIAQIHIHTVRTGANGRGREIFGHGAFQRIGNDQRRRGQKVCAHVGRHASFKVAVARNH